MEKKQIILTDGRELKMGPFVYQGGFSVGSGKFEVNISVGRPGEEKRWWKSIKIMEIEIPNNYFSIKVPEFKKFEEELWTDELLAEVIEALKKSDSHKMVISYIVDKLTLKKKELNLGNNLKLIGDLWFKTKSSEGCISELDLIIYGNIKNIETEKAKETILFIAKHLYPYYWPGSSRTPGYDKNKNIWCKKLEFVVINYLKLLTKFACSPIDRQILKIAGNLTNGTEWSRKCSYFMQELRNLDFDLRNDSRLKKAFSLINEVCKSSA